MSGFSVQNNNLLAIGSLKHYLLYCEFVKEICEKFLPQFILANLKITSLLKNEVAHIIPIFDPESSLLPDDIRESSTKIYSLSRDYVYNVHTIFDKFYQNTNWSLRYLNDTFYPLQVMMLLAEMLCRNFAFSWNKYNKLIFYVGRTWWR